MRARPEVRRLIEGYYASIDTGRLDETARFLTPDATIQVATYPPMEGAEAVVRTMTAGLAVAEAIRHEVTDVWEEDDGTVIFVVEAHYDLADGRKVTVPGTVIAKLDGERFASQRIFADLTPVYGQRR